MTRIKLATVEPIADVVALLEDALDRAKRGEVIGVGLVLACDQRADGTVYALGDGDIATLVLGCERLKMRLLEIA